MLKCNLDRRCSQCELKKKGCSTWKDTKEEKTPSGWDLNRFAIYCREFKEVKGMSSVNLTDKEKKNLINSMEFIDFDSYDGEMQYIVVEDNETNRNILRKVGLTDEEIEENITEHEIDVMNVGFKYSEYFDIELAMFL